MSPAGGRGTPRGSVAGIVLAGGRSHRFGRDKLAEEVEGRPLIHHPVSRLREVCDRVLVVLAADASEPPMPAGAQVTFAYDAAIGEGPLRGLASGLAAAGTEWAVVVGGDMPDLQSAVLREMLRAGRETGAVAVALSERGDAVPLPCVLSVGPAAEAVGALLEGGRRSLRDILSAVRTVVVDEATWTVLDPERRTLIDIDEPGDVER